MLAGYNNYTGGTTIYSGGLTVQNPFALGGAPMLNGQVVLQGTPGATYSHRGMF
jgi:hypothetical protein